MILRDENKKDVMQEKRVDDEIRNAKPEAQTNEDRTKPYTVYRSTVTQERLSVLSPPVMAHSDRNSIHEGQHKL